MMVSSHRNLILAVAVVAGCIVSLLVPKYTLPYNDNNHDHRRLNRHSDPKTVTLQQPNLHIQTVRRVDPGWDGQGQALYQTRIHKLERLRINKGGTNSHQHQWHGPKNNGGLFFVTPMNQNKHFWDNLNDLDTSENTFHILDKFVNPGETTVVDIGTWIGPSLLYHGQFSARSFGIEADPDAFAIVERNVELNRELNPAWGNKVSVDAGCISRPEDVGKLTMKAGTSKPGMSYSGIGEHVARHESGNAATWQVQCYSLPDIFDNYWGIQKPYLDMMIMIDIESYECKLVPSFFNWLKDETHLPKMLMSFHPTIDRCSHEDYEGVLRFLRLYDHVTIGSSQREVDIQMATVEDFKGMDNYFTVVAFQDQHAVDDPAALATAGLSIPDASNLAQSNADVSSIWLNDVDYNQKWRCGRYKCFFLSLTDPTNGYLTCDQRNENQQHSMQTYEYATRLKSEFNIRHFFTSPPFQMKFPERAMEQMSDDTKQRFLGADSVIVQPSRTAPKGSIIFKCNNKKRMYSGLDVIIKGGSKGFEQTLLKELADTILLVEAYPRLVYDFQFMIDLEGRIYHLDFDRMLRTMAPGTGQIKTCLEKAMGYIRNSMK